MRWLLFCVLVLILAALGGCNQGTSGGPGATGKSPAHGQVNGTFHIRVPLTSSTLRQGEQIEASIGIQRAAEFHEVVTLTFTDVPSGVTMEPAAPRIGRSEDHASVRFYATAEALPGDFRITITGRPTTGRDARVHFDLRVEAKEGFAFDAPDGPRIQPAAVGQLQVHGSGVSP